LHSLHTGYLMNESQNQYLDFKSKMMIKTGRE
jgi:hypothetical protein